MPEDRPVFRPFTILFLDQFSELGGAQKCLLDLLPAMRQKGWRAVIAAPGSGELFHAGSTIGAFTERLPDLDLTSGRKTFGDLVRLGRWLRQGTSALRRLIETYGPSLIYVNGPRMLPVAALTNRGQIPVVFHAHNYLDDGLAAAAARWAIRRCEATLVASCLFAARPLIDAAPESRRRLVYNGVADLGFRHSETRPLVNIGVVGRIAPEKGQDILIHSAALIAEQSPECRFRIIGSALFNNSESKRYHENLRRRAGSTVEFTGWSGDIGSAMSSLDLLVVPSTGPEATTRVIPEAWSAGVPVVASRIGGIAEIVEDGVTGFLVEPGSPRALAERIREVRALPAQRLNEITIAARRRYLDCFTLERYRAQVTGIIERLAAGSNRLSAQLI